MSAPVSTQTPSNAPAPSRPRTSTSTRTAPPKPPTTQPAQSKAAPPPPRDTVHLSSDLVRPSQNGVEAGLQAPSNKQAKPAAEGKWGEKSWEDDWSKRMTELHEGQKSGKISEAEFSDGIRSLYGESLNKFNAHKQETAAAEQRKAQEKVAADNQAYQADMQPRRDANVQGQKDIDKIVGIKDDKLRNLNITQKYSELSRDMNKMMGPDTGANWSTWATWASKQAGATIRQEDMGGVGKFGTSVVDGVTDALNPFAGVGGGMARKMMGLPPSKGPAGSTYDGVSKSIADGNKKVFEEIAPHFDRFINTFKGDTGPNDRKWAEFSQGFKGDQQGLREAFRNYYDARNTDTSTEAGKKAKAELMLMGNDRIGLHEQKRLQPEIEGGMPYGSRKLLTYTAMGLQLPGENVSLGSDLPNRLSDGQQFPKNLKTIDNPQLNNLLQRVDRTPNTTAGSGASDWSSIDDRMNFISDLFRSRHDKVSLFQPPFDGTQVQQMKNGIMPNGPL